MRAEGSFSSSPFQQMKPYSRAIWARNQAAISAPKLPFLGIADDDEVAQARKGEELSIARPVAPGGSNPGGEKVVGPLGNALEEIDDPRSVRCPVGEIRPLRQRDARVRARQCRDEELRLIRLDEVPVEDLVALRVPARRAEQKERVVLRDERALRIAGPVRDDEAVLALKGSRAESRDERRRAVRAEREVVAVRHPHARNEAAEEAAFAASDVDDDRPGRPLEQIEDDSLRIGRPPEDPGEESLGTGRDAPRARAIRIDDPQTIVDQRAIRRGRHAPNIGDLRPVGRDRRSYEVSVIAHDLHELPVFEIDQRESVTRSTTPDVLADAQGKPTAIRGELATKFVGRKRVRPRGLISSVLETRELHCRAAGN